jgi:hypothetical protein
MWCDVKHLCVDEYGDLADRDSDMCRRLIYHFSKGLKCESEKEYV